MSCSEGPIAFGHSGRPGSDCLLSLIESSLQGRNLAGGAVTEGVSVGDRFVALGNKVLDFGRQRLDAGRVDVALSGDGRSCGLEFLDIGQRGSPGFLRAACGTEGVVPLGTERRPVPVGCLR